MPPWDSFCLKNTYYFLNLITSLPSSQLNEEHLQDRLDGTYYKEHTQTYLVSFLIFWQKNLSLPLSLFF